MLFLFLSFQWSYADPFLMCDPPEAGTFITKTWVEITNLATNVVTEVPGLTQLVGNDYRLLDVDTLAEGTYKFRARWAEVADLSSDYSVPFQSKKPEIIAGLRASTVSPGFLVCTPPKTGTVIAKTFIEITNLATNVVTQVPGLAQLSGTEYKLFDMTALPTGKYRFRARWQEAAGWPSSYSVPFQSGKPKSMPSLRIGTTSSVP